MLPMSPTEPPTHFPFTTSSTLVLLHVTYNIINWFLHLKYIYPYFWFRLSNWKKNCLIFLLFLFNFLQFFPLICSILVCIQMTRDGYNLEPSYADLPILIVWHRVLIFFIFHNFFPNWNSMMLFHFRLVFMDFQIFFLLHSISANLIVSLTPSFRFSSVFEIPFEF